MEPPFEEPEAWARGFIEWVRGRLETAGYRGARGLFAPAYVAVAAGHLTGVDYFYEYAVDAYYSASDAYEEAAPLAEPRWTPLLSGLEGEGEGLAEFEERLADGSTVLCAEPILAAAVLGAGLRARVGEAWRLSGYTGSPGGYPVIVRRPGKKCRILVPGSLYSLALAGLSAAGLEPGGLMEIVVPDPALVRKTIFDSKVAYGELSRFLEETLTRAARRAAEATREDACREKGLMLVKYKLWSPLEAWFDYTC